MHSYNKGFSSCIVLPAFSKNAVIRFSLVLGVFIAGVLSFSMTAYAAAPYVTSAKITGFKIVTITYSEPVNSSAVDYVNWAGDLGSRALYAINGSGTNTIALTLDNNVSGNAIGGVTINSSLSSVSDNSRFSTTTIQLADGQPPVLSSVTVSSDAANNSFSKTGNVISISFTANEPITSVSTVILGHTVYAGGNGAGPYTVSYTISSSDAQDSIPVTVSFKDLAGNSGNASLSVSNAGTTTTTQTTTSPTTVVTSDYPASIYEVTRVPLISATQTPSYTFFSSTAGNITYVGSCTSATLMAVFGNNTITLNSLPNGLYNSCFVTVSNSAGISNQLQMSPFTVDTTQAVVAPTPSTTNNTTNAVPGAGCAPGALFSTTTGLACPSTSATQVTGCIPGALFSTTTGQACPAAAPTVTPAADSAKAPSYQFTLPLKYGSSGTEVLELQNRLVDDGYLHVTPNGYFGPSTQAAVKAYQKAHGISQLGNVGPATRAALNGQ